LVFEPTQLFTTQKRKRVLYSTIRKLLGSSKLVPKIIVMSLVLQVFHLAMPVLTGQVIDRVLPRGDMNLLTILMIGLGVMVVFQSIGTLVRSQLLLHMTTLLDVRMTLGFLDHMVTLPYSYFQLRGSADLMQRMNSNAMVREHLTSSILSVVLDALFVVVYMGILLAGSTTMALVTLAVGTIDIGVFIFASRQQHALMMQGIDVDTKAHSYQMELLNAIETLKSTGNEQRAVTHWSNLFVDSVNLSLRKARLGMLTDSLVGVLKAAGPLAIVAIGAMEVMSGRLTLGSMLALNAVTGEFLGPLMGLVGVGTTFQTVRTYLERVNDVLEAEPEQLPGTTRPPPKLTGKVELEHVSFRYGKDWPDGGGGRDGADRAGAVRGGRRSLGLGQVDARQPDSRALQAARRAHSLRRAGHGRSGLALAPAAARHRQPKAQPLRRHDPRQHRAFGSVALARRGVRRGEAGLRPRRHHGDAPRLLHAAARRWRHDLGRAEAALGAGSFSLVRRPAILLLDEATSALDALTEAQVQQSLDSLQCTRIVIAHRLSTIVKADLILVVEKGQVIESGDHQTLVEQGGFYAQLVATQMGGQAFHDDDQGEEGPPYDDDEGGAESEAGAPFTEEGAEREAGALHEEGVHGEEIAEPSAAPPAKRGAAPRRPLPAQLPQYAKDPQIHEAEAPAKAPARPTRPSGPPPLPLDAVTGGRSTASTLSAAQRAKLAGFRPPKPR